MKVVNPDGEKPRCGLAALRGTLRSQLSIVNLVFVLLLLQFSVAHAKVEQPRNPNSAKECALCHYRWIDTFFIDGKGSDLVPYQPEKVVAKAEMCFSCHDGSVVDSRAKVYNDRRHKINKPPPPHMKIPKVFPLDKDGNMQCATCHTAHGVSSEMGMEKTIFIRTSNQNSAMCRMCHTDKEGGVDAGNHPVDTTEMKIPQKLISRGAVVGKKKDQVICETCHTVHGSPNESFLIESARNSRLCLACHVDKDIFGPDGKRNHYHVINAKSEKVKIPRDLIKKGAKLGYNGEIICQTCHKVHNNKVEKQLLLIKKDEKSTLCLTCHKDKQYLADTNHNLKHSAPGEKNLEKKTVEESGICSPCHLPHKAARKPGKGEDFTTQLCMSCHSKGNIAEDSIPADYTHPLNVRPYKRTGELVLKTINIDKEKLPLPLFNKSGAHDKDGMITCTTCHDPHRWRADSTKGAIGEKVKGDRTTSFLRKPSPELCKVCHDDKFNIAGSKHDLNKVAPKEKNIMKQIPAESGLCETCHLVHGGQKDFIWARKIKTKSDNAAQNLCISCHNKKGLAEKKIIGDHSHPVNVSPREKGLATTLPLYDKNGKVSEDGVMTCQTCHDPHIWNPGKVISGDHYDVEGDSRNSFLRLTALSDSGLCENCHSGQSYIVKTDHDLTVTALSSKNIAGQTPEESGACGVCHLVHNGKNRIRLWAQEFGRGKSIMDMMCNACHSEKGSGKNKIPQVAVHPEGQLINNRGRNDKNSLDYFPLFNKLTGELEEVGDISCPSCHNVHQWDPRIYSRGKGVNVEGAANTSFLRLQTYSLLCIDCHGLDALFRFKYFHEETEHKGLGNRISR